MANAWASVSFDSACELVQSVFARASDVPTQARFPLRNQVGLGTLQHSEATAEIAMIPVFEHWHV